MKHYLFIDEISMLSRSFYVKLCHIISTAMEKGNDEIFGGINVILVGDFHQFPPIFACRSAPLYWPENATHDSKEDILGPKIFEQFSTVVELKEQIRIRDEIWHNILQHVCYGNCRQEDIDIIKNLIITNKNCPPTDYSIPPWKNAKLVTPCHAVRTQWNSAATGNTVPKRIIDYIYVLLKIQLVDDQSIMKKKSQFYHVQKEQSHKLIVEVLLKKQN